MQNWKWSTPPFWIRDRDDFGRPIDPDVLNAARRLWPDVLYLTGSKLNDCPRAAEVLEQAAFAVSRALRRRAQPVRDINSYLFSACAHRLDRIAAKEGREQPARDVNRMESMAAGALETWAENLLDQLQLGQLLSCMDDGTRCLFSYRCQGFSWQATAEKTGYANGHSAEVRFWKGVKAVRGRLSTRLRLNKTRKRSVSI